MILFLILKILLINYQKKGEYEGIISKIEESEIALTQIEKEINEINDSIMSESFEACVKKQVTKFNEFFKDVSRFLYNETYYLTYDIKTNRKTEQKYYEFSTFNANLSSGKKQGEIICFDIAMIMFLKSQRQCQLSFLLNDKKELMDNNQLIKVAQYAKENHIQLVFSMLADKVPMKFNNDENIILKLSQKDKLFRIENKDKV